MKERTLGSPALGNAIKRDHSPYCESKGPIVQEGFVAQRIRALQELQAHALAGNRSHSPMISCPPRWVKSYEPLSPPRSTLAPRLAVKVPAMSEYGAVKHHWASMAGGTQDDIVGGQGWRSSQRPPQSAEMDEPHSVTIKTIERLDPSTRTSPSSEHLELDQPCARPTKTIGGIDMAIERAVEGRLIEPEESGAVPTYAAENVGPTIKELADSQEVMQDELHTTPTKTTHGNESTRIMTHKWQELDPAEPPNAPTRSTQSVGSFSEAPVSNQEFMPGEALTTSRRSSRGNSVAVRERASSGTTERNQSHNPMFRNSQNSDDNIHISPRRCTPKPSEREILGPYPVPASLAEPLVLSRCISPRESRDIDPDHEYKQEQTSQQPRKSVADKLGALVERGWVGCDVFGRAYSQNADSESMSTTSHTYGDRADSQCVSSDQEASRSKAPFYDVRSSGSSTNGRSESYGFHEHDTNYMDRTVHKPLLRLGTPQPRKFKRREIRRGPETFPFERGSSRVGSGSVKTSVSSPTSKRRVFSLQHLYRLRRSNSEGIELRSFSQDSTATSRHDSVPARLSSLKRVSSESNAKDVVPGHEREQALSASLPIAPSSRRSTLPGNDYIRSSSRSTSWFKKSWLKTLLGDGKPMLEEDASQDHSTSTSASVSTDGARQDLSSRSQQQTTGFSTAHVLAKSDQGDESENATTSTTTALVTKGYKSQNAGTVTTSLSDGNVPLKRHGQRMTNRARTLSDLPPVSPFQAVNQEPFIETLKQHSHQHAQSPSGRFDTSMASLPMLQPSRRSSKRAATPSKSASLGSESFETSLHSPQRTSFPTSQTPRRLSPTSSTSVSVRIHRISRLSPVPLSHASGRPKAESTAEQLQQQVPEQEAVHQGLGRGRALKKIQVIISFDGAEDLVIEANAAGSATQGS